MNFLLIRLTFYVSGPGIVRLSEKIPIPTSACGKASTKIGCVFSSFGNNSQLNT